MSYRSCFIWAAFIWQNKRNQKEIEMKQDDAEIPEEELQRYSPFDFSDLVVQEAQVRGHEGDQLASDAIVFIDQPRLKVFCRDCRKQINKVTTIRQDGHYRCVVCFSKAQHSEQPFTVIRSLNIPLADSGWKSIHEILFLSFLQRCGFGNWKEIKEEMDFYGAKYREDEIQSHYHNFYLSNQDFMPKLLNNESFFQKKCEPILLGKPNPANPTSIASLTTAHQQEHEQYEQIDYFYGAHHSAHHKDTKFLQCYNLKRNQFQVQYDQQAELILANLQFREDDSEEETRIKFQLIDEYNKRLQRRNHVKKFVIEHRLLDEHYQKQMDKNRTDLQREAFEELKPIARMTTLAEYNNLVRKVAFTKQLKSTIEGLRKFRRTHPSSFKNLQEYLNSQPEQGRSRKRVHNQNTIKTGKKMQEMLQKQFKLNKRDFDHIATSLSTAGKKMTYKNVQVVLLQNNYDA